MESLGHLAHSSINRAILSNMTVYEWLPLGADLYSSTGSFNNSIPTICTTCLGAIGPNGSFWTARSHKWLQLCVVLITGEWLSIWSQNGSFSFVCSMCSIIKSHFLIDQGSEFMGPSKSCNNSLLFIKYRKIGTYHSHNSLRYQSKFFANLIFLYLILPGSLMHYLLIMQ